MYNLTIRMPAAKAIARQVPDVRRQIVADLEELAADPDNSGLEVEAIVGTDYFRLKFRSPARNFRAIFMRDDGINVIDVRAVEPRGQAYDIRRLQR